MRYEKWLGGGIGWILTGNPLGALMGFFAGGLVELGDKKKGQAPTGISELETNLIVLASYLIRIDGKVTLEEISFTQSFLNTYFDEKLSAERTKVLNHCLQNEYDLNVVCDRLRMYAPQSTRVQVIHFLFDLAASDGELNERENYLIFRLAGYLNVNDIDFKRIKAEHELQQVSIYDLLEIRRDASLAEIRNAYRRLVLKYHPDRNHHLSERARKELATKFQRIKEAYEKIKIERGEG